MSTVAKNPALADSATGSRKSTAEYYWLWVLCLLGLDYFSTLAYQPSITYHATKRLGPLATALVVLVTLFGALPIYCYLAGRSPGGTGSLGIIHKLIRGWRGKTLVLILLGFAATDFTMLKSLSLADASVHLVNKHDGARLQSAKAAADWCKDCARDYVDDGVVRHVNEQLIVTVLLGVIAFIFWFLLRRGFNRNVLVIAVPLVGIYLLMTGVLIVAGLWHLFERPEIMSAWLDHVQTGNHEVSLRADGRGGWAAVVLWSMLALPNLALGLSGFELSMILMPQVKGKAGEHPPTTRIWNTRKVLIVAALVMSIFLIGSVLVTTLLIPAPEFERDGKANNRALAYLAHGGTLGHVDEAGKQVMDEESLMPICGPVFGTAYDFVTVLILCLAGTSVMTALSVLLPMFLLRFGMEFRWAERWGLLLVLFAAINLVVTIWFQADVEDQRGAYATGVLVLIACAGVATVFDKRRPLKQDGDPACLDSRQDRSLAATTGPPRTILGAIVHFFDVAYYSIIAAVFVLTMVAVAVASWSGLGISLCFIAAILALSIASRAWRADERRTIGFEFKDKDSEFMWHSLRAADFPILMPLYPGADHAAREKQIRDEHQLANDKEVVFLEVCVDDPSDFFQRLMIEIVRDGNRYVILVTNCTSIAHAVAAIALEMSRYSKPPSLHFGWPERDMLSASWSYLAFGEGNIPWKVRELIHRMEPDPKNRPRVIVG